MKKEEINKAIDILKEEGVKAEYRTVVKNGVEMDALSLLVDEGNVNPVYYWNAEKDIRGNLEDIREAIKNGVPKTAESLLESLEDKEYVISHVVPRARMYGDRDRNVTDHLLDIDFEFYISLQMEDGITGSAVISKALADGIGCTKEEICEAARKNITRIGYEGHGMLEVLSDLSDEILDDTERPDADCEGMPVIIYTKNQHEIGSPGLLYSSEVMQKLHKEYGDCYIIPSSIHEFMLQPVIYGGAREGMDAMIKEVNEQTVNPTERLSDHVYLLTENGIEI